MLQLLALATSRHVLVAALGTRAISSTLGLGFRFGAIAGDTKPGVTGETKAEARNNAAEVYEPLKVARFRPGTSKRRFSAWNEFTADMRLQVHEASPKWKALSKEEQQVYVEKARQKKVKYEEEYQIWAQKFNPNSELEDIPKNPRISALQVFMIETGCMAHLAAEKWKALSEEEKQVYVTKAEEERCRRRKVYQKWLRTKHGDIRAINAKLHGNGQRKIRLSHGSRYEGFKRPPTAWMRFVTEHYNEHEGVRFTEVCKRCSPVWRALPEERKKVYYDAYARDIKTWHEQRAASKAQSSG
ncbi:hypothetical protein D9756_007132 [Leucocoprinus leucothites]|uniref:HMG box domain-containing protein n=1 Tax=Leucocoprinus leucothites TaxID=201217 RepID=A0A8H5D690_9AGAR|nr:hypothetical protein D9756_007132 [Leucoagaricus leucothites]